MSSFLGIDTSNYTTSAAIYCSETETVIQKKKPLPVKSGEKGLRQSDAVFHHTVGLPEVVKELFSCFNGEISAVGVSDAPRSEKGSYMPCFLAGVSVAQSVSSVANIPVYRFSHQQGHIASVVMSTKCFELLSREFIAFHLSGGTTEAVLVRPDRENIFTTEIIARSLDLKAGQAIDRTGVMLGLPFPCGAQLDAMSLKSNREYRIRPSLKSGGCSLSGIENKCKKMFSDGEKNEDIAKFCIDSIICAVDGMCSNLLKEYGDLPIVFSGGVSSNTLIRNYFKEKYNAVFALPEFSCDNAAGTAFLTSLKRLNYD